MSPTSTNRMSTKAVHPWIISGLGGLSVAFFFVWCFWFSSLLDSTDIVVAFGTVAIPALGLVWGGYRLERSSITPPRYGRLVQWCLGGAVGFLAINVFVMVFYPWYDIAGNISWAHFSVNMGAIAGFAVGYVEARAIQREVEATAAAVRAEQLEEEREVLAYLNDLLRHEVLNSTQIIGGHASLLLETTTGDDRDHLETITQESDALTDVITDVRAMLNANQDPERSAVDLSEILTAELRSLKPRFDTVDVDASIPETVRVNGNDGIRWIFANLLENAIEHNESDQPHIDVTVETTAETVAVRIADNGPGIPAETRERLFERKSTNHGLGLYLVRILAKRYGGTVELTETGPDGSVFTVTLSRATTTETTDDTDDAQTATDSATVETDTGSNTSIDIPDADADTDTPDADTDTPDADTDPSEAETDTPDANRDRELDTDTEPNDPA